MRKIKTLLAAAVVMLAGAASTLAAEVPLRSTFEQQGAQVLWSSAAPDEVAVRFSGFEIQFPIGTNEVKTDEGTFTAEQKTYIDNGTTYISQDAVPLVQNLRLYHGAIIDAMQADADERMPLKAIDTSQEKVLVCTWNRYPQSYPDGQEIELKYGDVWVFTAEEIKEWGKKNGREENMELRMQQLIGLPPQKGYTHFSLLWVNPEDLYRPVPDPEIDDTIAELNLSEDADEAHKAWFNGNIIDSYYPHRFPWTRLGYTYDWADNGTEYGLSEFILRNGAKAAVEKTYTNEEFYRLITE